MKFNKIRMLMLACASLVAVNTALPVHGMLSSYVSSLLNKKVLVGAGIAIVGFLIWREVQKRDRAKIAAKWGNKEQEDRKRTNDEAIEKMLKTEQENSATSDEEKAKEAARNKAMDEIDTKLARQLKELEAGLVNFLYDRVRNAYEDYKSITVLPDLKAVDGIPKLPPRYIDMDEVSANQYVEVGNEIYEKRTKLAEEGIICVGKAAYSHGVKHDLDASKIEVTGKMQVSDMPTENLKMDIEHKDIPLGPEARAEYFQAKVKKHISELGVLINRFNAASSAK